MPPNPGFPLVSRSVILSVVAERATGLHLAERNVDGQKLLLAFAAKESSAARSCGLRTEPAYSPGGKYFKGNAFMEAAFVAYGKAACGSWGPWQILYPTAYEMGFRGMPWELFTAGGSAPWIVNYMNKRCFPEIVPELKGWEFVAKVADGYNSGTSKDKNKPGDYMAAIVGFYEMPFDKLKALFLPSPP